jgi:hypothetical protein
MGIYDRAASVVQDSDKFEVRVPSIALHDGFIMNCILPPTDVYNLHREGCRQLWFASDPSNLPASHRSPAGPTYRYDVLAIRCFGAQAG